MNRFPHCSPATCLFQCVFKVADVFGPGAVEEVVQGIGGSLQVAVEKGDGVIIDNRLVGLIQVGPGEMTGARKVQKILGSRSEVVRASRPPDVDRKSVV